MVLTMVTYDKLNSIGLLRKTACTFPTHKQTMWRDKTKTESLNKKTACYETCLESFRFLSTSERRLKARTERRNWTELTV